MYPSWIPQGSGPDGYPRVLDYSIFKSLLVPYSKNFTTRPSSPVVVISTFFVGIIEISTKWKSVTFVMDSCVTPNNYKNIHLPSSLNSRTVFHVVPQGLCWTIAHLDIGRRLLGVHAQEAVQTVRPHYLQNTHTLGILGGPASQFSCYRLIRFRLNYSHRCTAMTFNYCHFSRVNLLFISNVFFFQDLYWMIRAESSLSSL